MKGFSGPVGSGKSAALIHESLFHAYENRGRTGLIGAPTYSMLRDATLAGLLAAFDKGEIRYELNRAEMTIELPECGSKILLRSLDAPDRLRGSNLAWFGIDELTYCSEEAWIRLEARLRDPEARKRCGFAVWTPKGFDWVYRRFRASPVEGYGLVEAKAFENRHLLKAAPDYYERLKASYDEAFYEQEVLGRYRNLQAGQVYYAFDRAENVKPCAVERGEPLIWSWDFNVHPMCSVIAQRKGAEIRVVDEIRLGTSSTPEVCEEFERRYGEHRAGLTVTGDASGRNKSTKGAYSDYELIQERFRERRDMTVRPPRSNPPVRERINLVNALLKSADGERRLWIDPRCRGLIEDLERVTYKADSGAIDKDRDPDRTHLSDALGYLLWQEFGQRRVAGERSGRLL